MDIATKKTRKLEKKKKDGIAEFCQNPQTSRCSAPCPLTEPQRSRYGYCNLNIAAALHRINEPVLPPALQDSWRPWCRLLVTDSRKINWRSAAEQKSASIKINKNFPAQLARRSLGKVVCTKGVSLAASELVSDLGSPEGGSRHTNSSSSTTPCRTATALLNLEISILVHLHPIYLPASYTPTHLHPIYLPASYTPTRPRHMRWCAARHPDANPSSTLYCFAKRLMAPQDA